MEKKNQNRIDRLFRSKNRNILSVYFTAGYPGLNDTAVIIQELQKSGADLIEIGIPFSDPTADGPTIQYTNQAALKNGMNLKLLFSQLEDIRGKVDIPLIMMGYFNPVLQFGVESFCRQCSQTGIDGVILPDLPLQEFDKHYRNIFNRYDLYNILLISPQTSGERVRQIDKSTGGFIYMVSSSSTTGEGKRAEDFNRSYFERINNMDLKHPRLIGFGISDKTTFENACNYANGAIIGSAFVKSLKPGEHLKRSVQEFTGSILTAV